MHSFIYRIINKYYSIRTQIFYKPFFKKGGYKAVIVKPILITPSCIEMGNKVFIRNGARIEGVQLYEQKKFTPTITIGNHVSIEQYLHLTCADSVSIGDNTAIANNVTITDIDHPYTDISVPIEKQPINAKPVSIGADSKIFSNAVILQGVHLGKHTVVAANAVVRAGVYPDYCILAGIPAKIVKLYNAEINSWQTVK
jgi:acetyltransferase-like isoleucine patch superfamily enzyme